jgi:hypothetical protein
MIMKILQSTLFIVFTLCLSCQLNAQSIVQLSHGNCWVYSAEDSAKVSDFPNNTAFEIDQIQISDFLVDLIGFKQTPEWLGTNLHCGAFGHSLIFNIKVEQKEYCIWSYKSKNEYKVISYGVSEVEESACDGNVLGSILLFKSSNISEDELQTRLGKLQGSGMIVDYKFVTKKVVKVLLPKKDYFNEREVAKVFVKFKEFTHFEMEAFYHPVGEVLNLEGLSFRNSP